MKLKIEIDLKDCRKENRGVLLAASMLVGNICSGEIAEAVECPGKRFNVRDEKSGINGFYIAENEPVVTTSNGVTTVVSAPAKEESGDYQSVEGAMDDFFDNLKNK